MIKKLLATIALSMPFVHCGAQTSPVTQVVVPAPPGGPSDLIARIVIGKFQVQGETFVIDNRAGANGMIAARGVASDPKAWMVADGTLLTVNPLLYPKDKAFDIERDIEPVAGLLLQPTVLVVRAEAPWKTMKDLVAAAKTGNVSFASGGIGSSGHLTMGLFAEAAGFTPMHVPYKGIAPALTDLIGGRVDAAFVLVSGVAGLMRSGKLRALAVASDARLPLAPSVPTIAEAGLTGFRGEGAYFMMMSAKAPAADKEKVSERMKQALSDTSLQDKLKELGLSPRWMSMADAKKWIATEHDRNAKFIANNNIRLE